MLRTRARRLALAVALCGSLAGCHGREPAPAAGQPIVLRYASSYPPNHPFSKADIAWMNEVERRSAGRLRIQPYWGGTLISNDEATLELAHGVADLALVTPIYDRAGMTAVKIQAGFYAGAETPAQQIAVYKCLAGRFPILDEEMAGVTVLAIQGGSQLNLLTRRRPVTTLADFRGLRIRTPSEIAPLLRSLGADPVTMPMAEVYSALSKGVIDGVVAPPDTLSSLHFNEVAPYLNAWSIPRGAYPGRAISNKALARLPADLQSLLKASQPYWEAQLNASVEHGEKAGLAFGHAHHEHFLAVPADQQASFIRQYNAASLGRAMALSGAKFDAKAMFEEAARAVAAQRSGRPAC